MNSRLRDWCTVPAKRAAEGLSHFAGFPVPRNLRDAFRPLWIALWECIAKEPFHLEKNGGLRCHGANLIYVQKPNRKLLDSLRSMSTNVSSGIFIVKDIMK